MQDNDSGPAEPEHRDLVDRLRDLAVLRDQGVLNETEFQHAKLRVLAEYNGPTGASRSTTRQPRTPTPNPRPGRTGQKGATSDSERDLPADP